MKERSLVAFTLMSQMAVGAFWVLGALHFWAGAADADALADKALWAVPVAMILAVLASFFHLGTPLKAWRAFASLRSSWLSREILFAVLFTGASGLLAGLEWFKLGTVAARSFTAWAGGLLGLLLIYSMANAYRLRTVPAWDTWMTPASFFITTFLLGGLAVGAFWVLGVATDTPAGRLRPSLQWIALGAVVLLSVELVITSLWIAGLAAGRGAASRAAARITQRRRSVFRLRLALAVLGVAVAGVVLSPWGEGPMMSLAIGLVLASEVLGRLLFYEARVRHGV